MWLFTILFFFLSCVTVESGSGDVDVYTYPTSSFFSQNKGIERAKDSSVLLRCIVDGKTIGYGSGNLFYQGRYIFIITANHVIDKCKSVEAVSDAGEVVKTINMYQNWERDVAIIKPLAKFESVKPVPYKVSKKRNLLGTKIVYVGHPDGDVEFLHDGIVSRVEDEFVWLHSVAWGGASGSAVFDNSGRLVGVLHAIRVSYNPVLGVPILLEDYVMCSRLDFLDKSSIKSIMSND